MFNCNYNIINHITNNFFYSVLYSEIDLEGDIYEIETSAEKSRKHDLSHRDPVYTIDLINLIRQTVDEQRISSLVNQVDATILEKVKELLN